MGYRDRQDPQRAEVWAGKGAALPAESARRERGFLGLRWGLGLFFLQRERERRAGTFRLHSGLGGTGKCHAAKRRDCRQHREIWPGRTRPVSEIIPRRSDAGGRIRDASLSERSRPRSPPSIWQQRMRVMGESPGWKGRRGATAALLPRSHRVPGSPSPLTPTTPQPKAGDKQVLGITPAHRPCSRSCMAPAGAGTPRQGQGPQGRGSSAPITPKRGRKHRWRLLCPWVGASTPGTGKCHNPGWCGGRGEEGDLLNHIVIHTRAVPHLPASPQAGLVPAAPAQ